MAAITLGTDFADARAVPRLEGLLDDGDQQLREHARRDLDRYAQLGLRLV